MDTIDARALGPLSSAMLLGAFIAAPGLATMAFAQEASCCSQAAGAAIVGLVDFDPGAEWLRRRGLHGPAATDVAAGVGVVFKYRIHRRVSLTSDAVLLPSASKDPSESGYGYKLFITVGPEFEFDAAGRVQWSVRASPGFARFSSFPNLQSVDVTVADGRTRIGMFTIFQTRTLPIATVGSTLAFAGPLWFSRVDAGLLFTRYSFRPENVDGFTMVRRNTSLLVSLGRWF